MDNERRKHLEATMKKFNKDQKDILFDFANNSPHAEQIPFGVEELDKFLGGGSPLRKYLVDYGPEDSGKSTRALHLTAYAQKSGKIVCYIDAEHKFDPDRAEALGVNLEELVLIQSATNAEQIMDAIHLLATEKVVDLTIVDSIQAMSPKGEQETKSGGLKSMEDETMALLARKLGQFFRITSPDVFRANMAVYMIGQLRCQGLGSFFVHGGLSGGNALKHFMSLCIFSRQGQKTDAPTKAFKEYFIDPDGKLRYSTVKEAIGFDVVIKMEKSHIKDAAKKNDEIHLPFYYESGFMKPKNLDEEVEIRIASDMTNAQKEEITKILIEKGIIPSPLTNSESCGMVNDVEVDLANGQDETVITDVQRETLPICKEEVLYRQVNKEAVAKFTRVENEPKKRKYTKRKDK